MIVSSLGIVYNNPRSAPQAANPAQVIEITRGRKAAGAVFVSQSHAAAVLTQGERRALPTLLVFK